MFGNRQLPTTPYSLLTGLQPFHQLIQDNRELGLEIIQFLLDEFDLLSVISYESLVICRSLSVISRWL